MREGNKRLASFDAIRRMRTVQAWCVCVRLIECSVCVCVCPVRFRCDEQYFIVADVGNVCIGYMKAERDWYWQ